MCIEDTSVHGVKLITPKHIADERGYFALTWAQDLFLAHGLDVRVAQRNLAYNHTALTLRGMHYQRAPHAEVKVVSCVVGAIYDVAIDLRPDSPTYRRWFGTELTAETGRVLYIPEGCAHGYVTLEPHCSVEYLVSEFYHPESAAGVRWNDPYFGIRWPAEPTVMNARDRSWPDFEPGSVSAGVLHHQ
jgi:dTDP-4-dehydrorhamnose 3,5-epimerase